MPSAYPSGQFSIDPQITVAIRRKLIAEKEMEADPTGWKNGAPGK
jgi:hypothetical protein